MERELPPGKVSLLDWYLFDVAAASHYQDIYNDAVEQGREGGTSGVPRVPGAPQAPDSPRAPRIASHAPRDVVQHHADGFAIRGTEIPPWER